MERHTTQILATENQITRIKTSLILINPQDKILFGRRVLNGNGEGFFTFPTGKVGYLEKSKDALLQGLKEKTGLALDNISLIDDIPSAVTEDILPDGRHFLTLYHRAHYLNGTPQRVNPDLYESWSWHPWENLPLPLSVSIRNLLNQEYNPFNNFK